MREVVVGNEMTLDRREWKEKGRKKKINQGICTASNIT
jgi:hypothetical protein